VLPNTTQKAWKIESRLVFLEAAMGEPMDRTRPMFVQQSSSYQEAYPEVESVTIESYEVGEGVYTNPHDGKPRETFGAASPLTDGFVRCSHPRCRRGGFKVEWDVADMVGQKLTEKEFTKKCQGDDGSPKGRRPGLSCWNRLHYRLTIKYKTKDLPSL
jgi:hypothetical protein